MREPRLTPERFKELSLLVIIAAAVVIFSFLVDDYLTGRFFNRVTTGVAITAVLALGQALVIITRNVDLSVGSVVGISAYVTGEFLADNPDIFPLVAVALAVGIGCGLGLVNGLLVVYGRVPAIVVTLGTMAIYRSWLTEHGSGRSITVSSLPDWVTELPSRNAFSLGDLDFRLVFVLVLVLVVVLQLVMRRARWGRRLYAVGSNPEAAAQAGLPQPRLVLSAFAACGALAGLAGFLFLARFGTITVVAGQGLELQSVGAAVVGGVSILGGVGTLLGALLGAVLINLLDQSLVRMDQVSEFWRDAVLGGLILVAVLADVVLGRRYRGRMAAVLRRRAAPQAAGHGEHPVAAVDGGTVTDGDGRGGTSGAAASDAMGAAAGEEVTSG